MSCCGANVYQVLLITQFDYNQPTVIKPMPYKLSATLKAHSSDVSGINLCDARHRMFLGAGIEHPNAQPYLIRLPRHYCNSLGTGVI